MTGRSDSRRFLALGLTSGFVALAGGVLRLITGEQFGLPLTVLGIVVVVSTVVAAKLIDRTRPPCGGS
jgi:hypothetical protein